VLPRALIFTVISRSLQTLAPSLKPNKPVFYRTLDEMLAGLHDADLFSKKPHLIINTLPLGKLSLKEKNPYACYLLSRSIIDSTWYFDMIYRKTEPLKLAEKLGIPHLDGNCMLLEQARHSFFLWTGIMPE
jgi:shikimate 5-dehydrogenase